MTENDGTEGTTGPGETTGSDVGDTSPPGSQSPVDKAREQARPYVDKAAGKVDELTGKAQPQINKAGQQAKEYLEKANEQLGELSEKAQPLLAKLAAQAAEFAGKAQEKLKEFAEAADREQTAGDRFDAAESKATGAVDDAEAKMNELGEEADAGAGEDAADPEASDESE